MKKRKDGQEKKRKEMKRKEYKRKEYKRKEKNIKEKQKNRKVEKKEKTLCFSLFFIYFFSLPSFFLVFIVYPMLIPI